MPASGTRSRGRPPQPVEEGAREEEAPVEVGADGEVAARASTAHPVPQVSSSSSGEEDGEEAGDGDDEDAEGPLLPSCPVCMNAWTADGEHRVSCIPCGHVYGRSCLEKWLAQCGKKSATCPQCGKMFRQKNIINLYAPEIVVPNNDLEKQQKLIEEVKEYKRQILYQQRLINESSSKRQKMAEQSSDGAMIAESLPSLRAHGGSIDLCKFVLQNEFVLDGARVMGIDASSQIIVASGRAPGVSAEHVLTKICMFSRQETKVRLPPNTKAVRDICITPGGLAIFASLGRKLSLLSMTTNNVVLQYDLPAPGWSCSGDQTGPNHVYAGLQNGMLLVFDTRQTKGPLHSLSGLSTNPVHTIHSVVDDSGSMKIISASSIGPCIWDVDGTETRPNLLTGTENQGVCISLACAAPSSDLIVASFRPRVEFSGDGSASQMGISQSPTLSGSGKLGCHALLRRTSSTSFVKEQICNGNVSELRMSKSAIIPCSGAGQHLFAYGDESLRGVRTWRLPSFQPCTDLRPHRQPILDLRFAESSTGEKYLGCLSEEKLQVFRIRS
ncbi:E3 ubiquitin-protein ligase RFWD3 isoform X2 [Triticum aestivum]|uniref:RING-type E3 ubiquitin transferase n=1 Tax=Triticum aestivum TaxID=4565 RepID=A0A3B5ZVZ9_WHEAT|nr:E3 ubiquitin-protein ligase RFWD3-like isoform X2 [Triticum aestivum]